MPAQHARLPHWEDRDLEQKIDALRVVVQNLYGFLCYPAMQHLAGMLDRHQPSDEHEIHSIERIRAMMVEHPDLFIPSCEAGHITGSALVIHPASRRVLFTFHKKLRRWLQMGGHSDFELDPAAIALREAREESGLPDLSFYPHVQGVDTITSPFLPAVPIDIDAHLIPARPDTPQHYHLDIRYLVVTQQPEAIQMDAAESNDLRWFDLDEVATLDTDASVLRLVAKARMLLDRA